jgi:hypothetical protein
MPKSENDQHEVEPLLAQVEQVHQLREKSLNQSAYRLADDIRRTAKSQQKLIPFLSASFGIMNISQHLFDPAMGRDAALESIALLESPERARAFQGDYETRSYEHYVHWMSACSYDNLAIAIGRMNGYNSEGMQACIADGIAVCRRTGKLSCVTCFREYATEVFRAADDLAMAGHQARTNSAKPVENPRNDRRWVGAFDETEIAMLLGQLERATECCRKTIELAPLYHTRSISDYKTATLLATILLVSGKASEIDASVAALAMPGPNESPMTPPGENLEYDLLVAQTRALAASLSGDHDSAIDILTDWDRTLSIKSALSAWFEVRLRLIAAHRFAGRAQNIAALSRQLEQKAGAARDFLSLRRLKVMSEPGWISCPFPSVAPFKSGPFAAPSDKSASQSVAATGDGGPSAVAAPATPGDEQGPLFETISAIGVAMHEELVASQQQSRPPQLSEIARRLIELGNGPVTHRRDAGALIFLASRMSFAFTDLLAIWEWAKAIGAEISGRCARSVVDGRFWKCPALEQRFPIEKCDRAGGTRIDFGQGDADRPESRHQFFAGRVFLSEPERSRQGRAVSGPRIAAGSIRRMGGAAFGGIVQPIRPRQRRADRPGLVHSRGYRRHRCFVRCGNDCAQPEAQ